jgi:FkbM family methyltransferase
MAAAKDRYAVPEPLLSPEVKNFLGEFELGRLGLRTGRGIVGLLRRSRDPVQRKLWAARFLLPVRNVLLFDRPLSVSLNGLSILLTPQGGVAGDLWTGLPGHTREGAFLLSVIEPGMIIFDVGANAGLFAIGAAKKIGGKNVFAFEPSSSCDLLRRNLKLNHITDLHVVQQALGEQAGGGTLKINDRGSLNTPGSATHPSSIVVGHDEVYITTVDTFMKERDIPRVDVMRVDIEGAEVMLFRGASGLLRRPDAPIILYDGFGFLTRGFGYHPVEILWLLESCGYDLFTLNSDTGEIANLTPDYQYNSMIIAAKQSHAAYQKLRGVAR